MIGNRQPQTEVPSTTGGHRRRPPGTFVMGMHRSGTSVVAGILDRLGLDGGSRGTMVEPDRFNTDGYWEQLPLIELHDRMLRRLGGYASAPPDTRVNDVPPQLADDSAEQILGLVDDLFAGPWFIKDPRQCLLLPIWTGVLGQSQLAVVVNRSPADVVSSLRRRNGYTPTLAAGLWERYTLDLLASLAGRPAVFVQYEDLLQRPVDVTAKIAEAVQRHQPDLVIDAATVRHAAALVRPPDQASSDGGRPAHARTRPEHHRLHDLVSTLDGYHPVFRAPRPLPDVTPLTRRRLRGRRVLLRVAGTLVGRDAAARSRLDRPHGRRVSHRPSKG